MKVNDSRKYFVTNYHVISHDMLNKHILLDFSNEKYLVNLHLKNRHIKFFEKIDITII